MNDIITYDPEQILATNNALFFMVVWSSSQGTFFGTGGGGFQSVEHVKMDSPAVERNRAIEEYYNLVRVAKSHPYIKDGRIELLPIPTLSLE